MFEKFHRGDIYSADLSPGIGSEQSGSRPVLILQNNVGNCFSPTIIIAAITSVSKKSRKFPTHYHLNDRCGLVKPCCYAGTDQNNRQVEVKKLYWSSKQG
jgi:mRNA-degrading endonuclease toxin of MazEF toxin-antitoxin module